MGKTKRKKTSRAVTEETVSEPEEATAPDTNKAEWLVQQTMLGRIIVCSHCNAKLDFSKGSLISNLIRNKYCYNCGREMSAGEL